MLPRVVVLLLPTPTCPHLIINICVLATCCCTIVYRNIVIIPYEITVAPGTLEAESFSHLRVVSQAPLTDSMMWHQVALYIYRVVLLYLVYTLCTVFIMLNIYHDKKKRRRLLPGKKQAENEKEKSTTSGFIRLLPDCLIACGALLLTPQSGPRRYTRLRRGSLSYTSVVAHS